MTNSPQTDEAAQIRSAQTGDSMAFGQLYRRYYERIYCTVLGMVGSPADAQEVTQLAWLKAWKHINDFNHTSAFTTWLHRIAVNTSLDHLRARKRWSQRFKSFWGAKSGDVESLTIESPMSGEASDPAAGLLQAEGSDRVHVALARLPEPQRIAIVLKEFEDYTYQEIADTVGCSIGTVMSRIHLARQKLRTFLTSDES